MLEDEVPDGLEPVEEPEDDGRDRYECGGCGVVLMHRLPSMCSECERDFVG